MKLRLDYFLSLGLKLSIGDEYDYDEMHVKISGIDLPNSNDPLPNDDIRFITSLATRKNTGEQPCGDDVPVVATHSIGECGLRAKRIEWASCGARAIESWKPDLEALIKMQIEHDKDKVTSKLAEIIEPVLLDALKPMKLTSDQIDWKDGMKYAAVCIESASVYKQWAFNQVGYNTNSFYIVKRAEAEPEQKPVEWVNGDECVYENDECMFVGSSAEGNIVIQYEDAALLIVRLHEISKPETAEQKAAKEREKLARKWVVHFKDNHMSDHDIADLLIDAGVKL